MVYYNVPQWFILTLASDETEQLRKYLKKKAERLGQTKSDEEIDQEIEPHGAVCNFEYIDDSAENTNFDFYFKKGDIEVFFEIKYTEREFSKKSSAKDPHAQYEVIYKPMIEKTKELFIGETISEQDFNNEYYQLARNSIRATSADKHVFFVCPKEHEELINQSIC